jgi:hypothetical protein
VKIETNLSKKKILDLESTGFQLPQRTVISPRRLFRMEELPFDLSSFSTPTSPDDYSKTRSDKVILKNNNAPTTKQANNCASSLTLKGHLRKVTMILHPGFVSTSNTWQQSPWANVASGQVASIFILFLLS